MTTVSAISTWIGVFDLCSFALVDSLENGTLVPKHVEVNTRHELYFIAIYLVHFLVDVLNC